MVPSRRLPAQRPPAIPDESRYAQATAAGGVAVWDWDLATNDIFVDPSLRMMLGYDDALSSNRVLGWARLIHPEDRALVLQEAQACLAQRCSRFEVVHRMLHRSGENCWFVTRGSVLRDGQGRAVRMLGAMTDVTDRKEAQLALHESEERFRQLAENTPQIFWLMSSDLQQLLYISPAYEEITGRTCAELYTNPQAWINAVHPEDRPQVMQAVQERQSGVRTMRTRMEYRYLRPDGDIRWMRAEILPILDESGTMYRISGIAEDITERKLHEMQLREARCSARPN
jgi:PAS domain S-box-containing protein